MKQAELGLIIDRESGCLDDFLSTVLISPTDSPNVVASTTASYLENPWLGSIYERAQ
jgi:hypothetical protein